MLMSTIAAFALLQTVEPPAEEQPEAYEPVAYSSPLMGEAATRVTLPSGEMASANDPQKIRRSRYIDRGQLGAEAAGEKTELRGLRIEARTGWDMITLGATGDDDRADGLIHGISAGYDYPFGQAFLGVFASVDGSTAEDRGVVTGAPDPLSGTIVQTTFQTDVSHAIELGVRAGWWVREGWNVFADGAWTKLTVNVDSETVAITPFLDPISGQTTLIESEPLLASSTETATGWRIGAGTEAHLTDRLYTTAKYRFTFYDEDEAGADTEQFEILTGVGLRF
ncbi:hypothetical protein DX908_15875 [Parvularcula marina]|uniref:Outer membrane protein beta-barrel domain-containing protein n=2 Tax=Parvularcula marina TaxID=2292771 RepID=A0A371R8H7_9PROT|nr:hypothetical protein DX908_15875 [Parvularcula marina]